MPILRCLLATSLALSIASAALADPTTYAFVSGTAEITATRTSDDSVVFESTTALNGSFVAIDFDTYDVDFSITLEPTGPIEALQDWGVYEAWAFDAISLSDAIGYSTSTLSVTGRPSIKIWGGPIDVDATFRGLTDPTSRHPWTNPASMSFDGASVLEAEIIRDPGALTFLVSTDAVASGGRWGELDDLRISFDVTWNGVVVPEPSSGVLLLGGLVALAASGRTRSRERPTSEAVLP